MEDKLKSAREMFEELGYEIVNEETSQDIPRMSWGRGLDDRFEIIYKRDKDLVLFEKDKSIATIQYGSGDDDDRIHYLSYGNSSLNLLNAINKQVEELRWNKMSEEMIKELLEKLKQCDDFHNRCDFLMEHSEITYMLDYIINLQQENQELKLELSGYRQAILNDKEMLGLKEENQKLKERINKSIKYISSNDIEVLKYNDIPSETTSFEIVTIDLLKILKGESNE